MQEFSVSRKVWEELENEKKSHLKSGCIRTQHHLVRKQVPDLMLENTSSRKMCLATQTFFVAKNPGKIMLHKTHSMYHLPALKKKQPKIRRAIILIIKSSFVCIIHLILSQLWWNISSFYTERWSYLMLLNECSFMLNILNINFCMLNINFCILSLNFCNRSKFYTFLYCIFSLC